MQQSHVADLPTTTLQPQVSTTNKPGLVPITVAHLSGQPTIHIVDQSSTALHLPMQSPIQSSLPTPPSSATRMTLQYSPDPQTSQFRPVTASVPTSCTQPRTSTDYINLNNHSSGERVIVQRQVTGPGHNTLSTAIPRRPMSSTQPISGPATQQQPTYTLPSTGNSAGSPIHSYPQVQNAVVAGQYSEFYRQHPPQPHQQQHAPQTHQDQQQIRRHSYTQAHVHASNGSNSNALPQSSSVSVLRTNLPPMVPAHHTSVASSSTSYSAPVTPEVQRQSQSAASSRSSSAVYPRPATNSHPQSPVVPMPQDTQMRASFQQHPQSQTQPHSRLPHAYQATSHPRPQPSQPVPRQSHQTYPTQVPIPSHPKPQHTQPQSEQQIRNRTSSAALGHAQAVLTHTASYLEYAYRSAVHCVATEFDKQNIEFSKIQETNKRLSEMNTQAEEERVFWRQERTKLLEEVARLHQESKNTTTERLLGLCREFERKVHVQKGELDRANEENTRLRELNNVILQAAYGRSGPLTNLSGSTDGIQPVNHVNVDPNDVALVRIGPFIAPRGLVKAIEDTIKEPIVQDYEARLAQVTAQAQREREFLTRRQSLLQELVRSEAEAALAATETASIANGPSDAQNATVPSIPRPASPAGRPSSVPVNLAPAASTQQNPEQPRSSSQQPQPSRVQSVGTNSFPTPPRTATPLEATDSPKEPIVKTEPSETHHWPWTHGEVIDLTLPDSPPPGPPADLETLGIELASQIAAFENSENSNMHDGDRQEKPEEQHEKKRSLEDDAGQEPDGSRKKPRVDGEDVTMEDASASQETIVPAPKDGTEAPNERDPPSDGSAASTEVVETLIVVERHPTPMEAEPSPAEIHQSPEPIATVSDVSVSAVPEETTVPSVPAVVPVPADPSPFAAALPPFDLQQASSVVLPAVKTEIQEPSLVAQGALTKPKLGIRHIDLVYHTSKTEMTCRMCFKRSEVDRSWTVKRFPLSAPWAELSQHCEEVHPAGFQSLINLDAATLTETRERLLAIDSQRVRR